MADETQILIPKESLPNCQVGEKLTITGEDEAGNFILETTYEEEPEQPAEGGVPAAVTAVMD